MRFKIETGFIPVCNQNIKVMTYKELKNGDFKALVKSVKTDSKNNLYGAEIYYKDFKFRNIFYGDLNKQLTIKRAEFIINNTKAETNNEILFLTLEKENYFNTIDLKPCENT